MSITGLSLGSGATAVDQKDLWRAFAPFGLSEHSFTYFLRAIGVPRVHMPSGQKLVDLTSLQLAWRAINRVGQPDFVMPMTRVGNLRHSSNRLDLKFFEENWKLFVGELLIARRLDYAVTAPHMKSAYEKALTRIAIALASIADAEHVKSDLSLLQSAAKARITENQDDATSL